jgi:hypothetical protein
MLPPDDEGHSWWTAGGRGELAGILQAPRAREAAPEPLRTKSPEPLRTKSPEPLRTKSQLRPTKSPELRAKTPAAGARRAAQQPKPRAAGRARARDSGAG